MAWHDPLMDRLEALDRGENPGPPPSEAWLMLGHGTANYKAMAWAAEYVRVMRYPEELPGWIRPLEAQGKPDAAREYVESWHEQVLDFFAEQKKRGFMCLGESDEQLCSDPHANFWIYAVAMMRVGAKEAGHQGLLDATTAWFRNLVALFLAGATRTGEVVALPAARVKGLLPVYEVATLVLRTARGLPHKGNARKSEFWQQRYFAGPRVFRRLVEEDADLRAALRKAKMEDAEKIKLRHPFAVETQKDWRRGYCLSPWRAPRGLAKSFATEVISQGERVRWATFDAEPNPDLWTQRESIVYCGMETRQ